MDKDIHRGRIQCRHAQSLSCVQLFVTPWTVARQAPLSMGFSRQEYWGGLPFPTSGDFPDPGIELTSPVAPPSQVDVLPTEPLGKPGIWYCPTFIKPEDVIFKYIIWDLILLVQQRTQRMAVTRPWHGNAPSRIGSPSFSSTVIGNHCSLWMSAKIHLEKPKKTTIGFIQRWLSGGKQDTA